MWIGDNGGVTDNLSRLDGRAWRRLALARANTESSSWAFPFMGRTLCGALTLVARRHWRGLEHLPRSGPALVVANHLSSLDPGFVGEFLGYAGRWPYFLAKSSLFRWPVFGYVFRQARIIPVFRDSHRAADALAVAREHLAAGHVVVIYPEGTTTHDPLLWPMAPRTGAARLALSTGVPVIPLGHWGVSAICPDNHGPQRLPHLVPRHDVTLEFGPPLDLTAYGCDVDDVAAVAAAGEAMMGAVTGLVERLRGETAPPGRWDPAVERRGLPPQLAARRA